MQVDRFCADDSVRRMDREVDYHGVLQRIDGQRATVLSAMGRLVIVLVSHLSLAPHEPSGTFDVGRP